MFKHGFPPEWSTLKKLIWLVGSGIAGAASGIWKTVTGTLIHLTDALASPMQKCEVSLEPIQAGSGDPSPDNVRPITGWTGCEVTRTGKNRFKTTANSTTVNGVTLTVNSDGTISCVGTAIGLVTLNLGRVTLEGGEYFVSGCPAGGSASTYRIYGSWGGNELGNGVTRTFANGTTVSLQLAIHSGVETGFTFKPMICLSSDSHEFEPYQGTTASVTFPDTVYGGKYDFVSGGLKPYKEYDSYNGETLTGEWMSSMDKYVAGTTPTIGAQVVDLDGYDTTVQLTPQKISTLKGVNNVWSNGDSVEITYKAQAE